MPRLKSIVFPSVSERNFKQQQFWGQNGKDGDLSSPALEQGNDRVRGELGAEAPGAGSPQPPHLPGVKEGLQLHRAEEGPPLPGVVVGFCIPQGSPNAGKLLLRLRGKQGLACAQFQALQDACGCSCTLPGLQEFVLPGVPSPAAVGCPARLGPHQNVAMACSVNVFQMKKGRLNPNY